MNTFLLKIEGLASENLTTEVLAFILTNESYSVYQRLFFNYLLGNNADKDTFELGFEINTQENFRDLGTPDIIIKNENRIYIIENKFYAPYSGENQISRYYKILTDYYRDYCEKGIFILTIKSRKDYYKKFIDEDIKNNVDVVSDVKVKYIFWEDILKLLKSNDFLIQNLIFYIKEKYLVNVTFNKPEMEILKNENTPKTLQKIFDFVNYVKEQLKANDFQIKKSGSSHQFYGFYIKLKNIEVWFGYFLTAWLDAPNSIYTPIYAQIRDSWSRIIIDANFESKLKELGFVKHQDFEWLKPFDVDLFNDIEQFINELMRFLEELDKFA